MTTPPSTWQPGDPLFTDNGCGTIASVAWTPEERAAARTEDRPPPWWRPEPEPDRTPGAWARYCQTCSVGWAGDDPCWMCAPPPEETP